MDFGILIIVSVIVIVVLFFILLFNYRGKFIVLDIKITEAEKELSTLLEMKRQMLISVCEKVDTIVEKDLFPDVDELKSEELNSFVLSKLLISMENRLLTEMNMRKAFVPDEELSGMFLSLDNISVDCESVEEYYNDNSEIFNRLLRRFPSNIVGKFNDYVIKEIYSHEEEEMFEILKD